MKVSKKRKKERKRLITLCSNQGERLAGKLNDI